MQYCLHHAYPKETMKRRTVLKLAANGAALATLGGTSPLVFGAAPLMSEMVRESIAMIRAAGASPARAAATTVMAHAVGLRPLL